MRDLGLTPEYFGLGVRSDKDALIVTAVNKMRYTEEIPVTVSLNGEVVETPYIHSDTKTNHDNYTSVQTWIEFLQKEGYSFANVSEEQLSLPHPQLLNVKKEYIIDLLEAYKSHYLNLDFRTADLVHLLSNYQDNTVDKWDVMIANGSGVETVFCGLKIKPIARKFAIKKDKGALQMSGKGSRLGSANLAKGGLTEEKRVEIEEAARSLRPDRDKNKQFSQEEYFNSGIERNPLLIIYPVKLKPDSFGKTGNDPEKEEIIAKMQDEVVIGLSIGIPSIEGRAKEKYQYRINLVKWKELLDIDDDYYEETGGED